MVYNLYHEIGKRYQIQPSVSKMTDIFMVSYVSQILNLKMILRTTYLPLNMYKFGMCVCVASPVYVHNRVTVRVVVCEGGGGGGGL